MYRKTFIIIFFGIHFYNSCAQSFKSEEGPYQAVIANVSRCSAGAPAPWLLASIAIAAYTSKGQSLLRGRFNVTKELKDMKFRLTVHYIEAKAKVKVFDMKNQNCHNNIIELILLTIRVPFNRQNCRIKPGYYEFHDLNIDAIMHTVVQSLWYGAAQLRLDVSARAGPLLCVDIFYRTVKI